MAFDILHAGLGWPAGLALIVVSFVSSFITAAFGIGGGAVMLAVLATFLPAAAIIPVHGAVQVGSNAGRAAILMPHVHRAVVVPFAIGAMIGVALGGLFVVQLDAGAIQIGVGMFILWSILFRPPAIMRKSALLAGGISSFLTMFFGGTGPFVAAYLKTLKLGRMGQVASQGALMTIQHVFKTVTFAILGFAFAQWVGLILLLVVFGFLGTVAGRHILLRTDERRFKIVLDTILTLLALRLIYAGTMALWFSTGS